MLLHSRPHHPSTQPDLLTPCQFRPHALLLRLLLAASSSNGGSNNNSSTAAAPEQQQQLLQVPASVAMGCTRIVMNQIVAPSDVDLLKICRGGQVRKQAVFVQQPEWLPAHKHHDTSGCAIGKQQLN